MFQTGCKDEAMGKTQVYHMVLSFKKGNLFINNKFRSGPPFSSITDENVQKFHAI